MLKFDETQAGKDAPESWKLSEIVMTSDFQATDSPYRNIPEAVKEQMSDLYTQSMTGNVQIIKRLERLIEKYPRVPALYNYLSMAYLAHKNFAKGTQINELMMKRFPDYPVARINKATQSILRDELDKAEDFLGKTMDIKDFMPNRKVFHISEVCQFYETTVRYFIHKRAFDVANSRLGMLKELSAQNDNFHAERIKRLETEIKEGLDEIREEIYESYMVEETRKEWVEKSDIAPVFTHPEIIWLYENGFDIEKEKIEQLLALPRTTLIQDLHKVLDDAMARFDYFTEQDWDEKTHNFPTHALFLLAELRAKESLSHALNLIRQDNEWMEYWFGDLLTESMPMHFYKMIGNDLSILKNYLLEPANESFQRMVVTTAVNILAYHHPERKQACIAFFEDILNDFYENREQYENIIDIDVTGSIVSDLLDLESIESYPIIEKCYVACLFDESVGGNLEEIKQGLPSKEHHFYFKTIPTIFDEYQMLIKWNSPIPEQERKTILSTINANQQKNNEPKKEVNKLFQASNTPKIGRNDPCPCGSGKKYKKCHGE